MRPHRLRVQAFGAFAATEQITFDDLEGLFLLHGETGAGKTTLLDAIAFALYGRVPGERGTVRRLRSDHAAPGLATEVELEATIGARRLRIIRRPEQERPKRSGTGTTREQASVRLDELSAAGTWESKSTRVVEADQEIGDLMGMSAVQFFQVVLLPQGQFAKFLHADARDKEALLRKLFGTDRYRAVEEWLAERRRATAEQVRQESEALDLLMARVAQAADVPLPLVPTAGATAESTAESTAGGTAGGTAVAADLPAAASADPWQAAWAVGLTAAAGVRRDEEFAGLAARKADLEAALAASAQAGEHARRQRRRTDALRRQAELDVTAGEIARLRAEADAAGRAAEAKADLDAADRAARASADAARAEAQARGQIPGEYADPGTAGPETLRIAAAEQRMRLGRLDQLRETAREATAEEQGAARARSRAASLEADASETAARAHGYAADRSPLADARQAADQAVAALPAAADRAKTARQIAGGFAALVRERAERDRLREAHLAARDHAATLREDANRLHQTRIDGMSAELAATLFDGYECPVCGSLDHPHPKERTFDPVSREQETAADAAAEDAARAADTAGQRVAACQAVIADLAQRLTELGSAAGADTDAMTLAASAAQAAAEAGRGEAEAARIKAAADQHADLRLQLEGLDKAIADAESELVKLAERRTAALDEATAADSRSARLRADLRAQLGDAPDLESVLLGTRRLADALGAAADAADSAVRAATAAAEAAAQGARTATDKGFATVEAARAAVRDARWRRVAADQISRHEADAQAVETMLADPDLNIALEPPAPVDATAEAAAGAQQAHDAATGALATASLKASALASLTPLLADKLATLTPLRERADQIRHLAELANGSSTANQYKMTLSSFVLAARLEEVAAAASDRLLTMTAGRYSLAHSDARKGNSKAGLALLACDSWTGIDRDTATLSGGETFLASLALALGLADVVTAEAAGTPMEALFVDEGFGTLDEDALDEVMNVLDGLREGGRIVGIVSHVAELRQRVPSRIHVAKGRHGSHVSVSPG